MPLVLEQFIESLKQSRLMSAEQIQEFLEGLPPNEKPKSAGDLAKTLFRKGKLTKFQAESVYRGKARRLVFAEYVVLDRIGAGGMGEVYQAQHRRMKRTVAIKLLPSELIETPGAVERFEREVEAAAKLIHPNVVTAFDAGEAGGVHFLVMEYVEGRDLAAVVQQQGPLDVATALDYVLQAARGLEYAHAEGVVHRDIKPSNLLLDKNGTVKILDMGLARFVNEVAGDASTAAALTQSGQVMGTVDYMSPEQAASTKNADKPADIYSLGATLYYLLTRRPMYGGETIVEKIMAHRDKPVPSLRSARSDVSPRLDETYRAMVAKTPALRQRSMGQVIEEIQRCMPAEAAGRSSPQRAAGKSSVSETADFTGNTETLAGSSSKPPGPVPTRSIPARRSPSPTRRVAAPARSKKRQSQWDDALKAADRQYKRRHNIGWLNKLRNFSRKTAGMMLGLGLAATVVAAAFFGAAHVWQDYHLRRQCRTRVLEAVAPLVKKEGFEPISALEWTNAPAWQEMPEEVTFEATLIADTSTGRRPVGRLSGKMERSTGRMLVDLDRSTGKDLRGVSLRAGRAP